MRAALLFTVLATRAAFADSPLTSIELHEAYKEHPLVTAPREKQLAYLTQQSVPNAEKLVVASALGWGQDNAAVFEALLKKLRPGDVSASDLLVDGFLLARDDYLDLEAKGLGGLTAPQLLEKAAAAFPDDFAVQFVNAMVKAQGLMAGQWCDVWRVPEAVLKRFPPAKRNLKPSAVEAAQGYLHGYAESCPSSPEAKQKSKDELNQVYTLAKLGPHVVAGTQGGVVVWDPGSPAKPVAVHQGFICNVVALGASIWGGCEDDVVRWDGHAFKSYLPRTQGKNSAEYYVPMKGPKGALWVRLGARVWLYDAATDRFQAVTAPWKKSAYDALVRANGETWWLDFLSALVVDGRRIALRSAQYPGTDPRRFSEDERGTLWVEDFESGMFRYDDATKTFAKLSGLDAKASGVARDAKRGRFLLLHYTDGLVVVPDVGAVSQVRLPELQYMRDFLADENGDVWVAGWTGLMRLRPDGSAFGKQLYAAP